MKQQWLESCLSNGVRCVKQAREALERGDKRTAREMLDRAIILLEGEE